MAKRTGETLSAQISRLESFVRLAIYTRYRKAIDSKDLEALKVAEVELDDYLGPWDGKVEPYQGRLGLLYLRRELERCDLNGRIQFLEGIVELARHRMLRGRLRRADQRTVKLLEGDLKTLERLLDHLRLQRFAQASLRNGRRQDRKVANSGRRMEVV